MMPTFVRDEIAPPGIGQGISDQICFRLIELAEASLARRMIITGLPDSRR
jgi:hypothetical protein